MAQIIKHRRGTLAQLQGVTLANGEIGIVSKDSSILNIDKYIHEDVKLPLAAYIKKEEFGPPTINLDEIYPNDLSNFLFSRDSLIKISNDSIKSEFTSKSIEDMLYGNQFGIKTVRPWDLKGSIK